MSRWSGFLAGLPALLVCFVLCSCTEPSRPLVVSDPDPSVKIPAIKKAVADEDWGAVGQMIKDLDSDDPAVRFYAIEGLRRLTGEDFGYEFYQERAERQTAEGSQSPQDP